MNLKSQARHFFTFLAGLGTLFVGWNIIAPDQVDAVNKAGGDLVEPLVIIIGAVGACVARAALSWIAAKFSGGVDKLANKSSGGMSGGANLLILGTMAAAVGCLLPSCSTWSGTIGYADPETGIQGGLTFKPGEKLRGGVKVPILDAETGKVVGYVDLASGK